MNLITSLASGSAEINIGLMVQGNAYFVADFPRYLSMTAEQLDASIDYLQQLRRENFTRFIRHRTVPWFGGSCVGLCVAMVAAPLEQPSLGYSVAMLAWIIGAVLPSLYMMTSQRKDLFHALALLKDEIKKAKAARATK